MSSEDLFTVAKAQEASAEKTEQKLSNVPEMSVSDLAHSLKRTLEETYSHIRVRGELSGLKLAASGHLYGDIKDVDANINIICWRGTLSKLSLRPEEGMDVVITGRVSSYAKSSRYQIIIESIELAGEGALLKLLEERRKKLAAEGLFNAERKQKLPFLPHVIGVITSPTGAVIQDIMHRLKDRFPRHVLLWPVAVQGKGADEQIAAAINGFNTLDGSTLPRPDLLIIARGGGSLEDLMPFNEEIVVRAVANSSIPIISAVGHETDTTLVDYAADLRAPTPTGAAEMAVPLRINLLAQLQDRHERLLNSASRLISERKNMLATQTARLGNPKQLLENKTQTIDFWGEKLSRSLLQTIQLRQTKLHTIVSGLTSPKYLIENKKNNLAHIKQRLEKTLPHMIADKNKQLISCQRMLDSLSPKGVLNRGYALVYDSKNQLIRGSANISSGQDITIEFANNDKLGAKVAKK
ncbi:MAG: exodeoxyribonuclease VII large subunit [Alphaproteobacteria bacterium]|nr:exodeoxyribonuclease VII large subunit [Alphaproteobacteria bacterium]